MKNQSDRKRKQIGWIEIKTKNNSLKKNLSQKKEKNG